jgi:hypothetical protein
MANVSGQRQRTLATRIVELGVRSESTLYSYDASCSTWGDPKTLRVRQSPTEGNPPAVLDSPHWLPYAQA